MLALRHLGTARTGAYFAAEPFIGSALSVLLLEGPLSARLAIAAHVMGFGVWRHLSDRYAHGRSPELLAHDHRHVHDAHHKCDHAPDAPGSEPHSHPHRRGALTRSHPRYPKLHHRHGHVRLAASATSRSR